MLDGWFCRSMANEQAAQQDETTDHSGSDGDDAQTQTNKSSPKTTTDYKEQYRYLKRKFKFLIYENEFFQDALRSNQRRLLKVSRDRAFLLDRLLQYERPDNTSSDSDETESSDDEAVKETKKRKLEKTNTNGGQSTRGRKKKLNASDGTSASTSTSTPATKEEQQIKQENENEEHQPGHMTPAEVERHLQARQPILELIPERTPATVPAEMFSNEPSLDSESNEHHMMDGSPTHVAAEECVPMEYCN